MITKEELLDGLELLYTGKAFKGFKEENPFVTFLGYAKRSHNRILVKYSGRSILTSLKNVVLKRDTLITNS